MEVFPMRRRIARLGLFVSIAMLTLTAGPSSAQVPPGEGLSEPFTVQCEGLGTIMVVETRGGGRSVWSVDGDHIVLQSVIVTAPDGTVLFSQSFGTKAGLTTFGCEADLEEDGTVVHVDAIVALVPPS
jgi:hypothetical protein